jgi:hypothetical protein
MIKVNFPEPDFRIKTENNKDFLFDPIRKQWILLTPEEWVRQNFVQFLVKEMLYPLQLIAIEKEIKLGTLKKRFDVLVYDQYTKPWMLIECKAGDVSAGETAFHQALRYQIVLPAPFIVITNGNNTQGWHNDGGILKPLTGLPLWERP